MAAVVGRSGFDMNQSFDGSEAPFEGRCDFGFDAFRGSAGQLIGYLETVAAWWGIELDG